MTGFGKRLMKSKHGPWAGSYIEYDRLKKALLELGSNDSGQGVLLDSSRSVLSLPMTQERTVASGFEKLVDQEIEKIVLFFLQKQGELARRFRELTPNVDTDPRNPEIGNADIDTQAEYRNYVEIGEELVLLVNFVELNVTGVRKILKKHDKLFYGVPMSERYFTRRVYGNDSQLQQIYNYEGIAALVGTLKRRLEHFQENTQPRKIGYFTFELSSQVSPTPPILRKIEDARRRLNESSGYAKAMAARALLFEDEDIDSLLSDSRPGRQISSILNLASTFLYMTNYFIVAPTYGAYAARLGMSEALAGVIIGMTPCAALVASVLYSWWSNRSYRHALLFAATCSIVGDILYALALPFKSISLIFLGRLLNGFGGARAINRRYIADAYPKSGRTAASAAFVTAGALGMAAGPALAVVADQMTPNYPKDGSIHWWTVETAPGWTMVLLWSVFLILAVVFFEEPERHCAAKYEVVPIKSSEAEPLVRNVDSHHDSIQLNPSPPLYKNVAVMTSLLIYLVLKLVLECLLSSTGTVTSFYFDWDATRVGVYLAVLGLLMFPANLIVAIISRRHEDRAIVVGTQIMVLVGTTAIIGYIPDTEYSVYHYISASVCCFLGTNMLEAPIMSILSKTIPPKWAKGTFNSGLLATEAGTFGRVLGDLIISIAGLAGIDRILDLTFVPMTVIMAGTLLITLNSYAHLEPDDDDDD